MQQNQVSWADLGPAEFDRRRMAKGHKPAAPEQAGLFFAQIPAKPAKPAPVPPELPGQDALFGGSE